MQFHVTLEDKTKIDNWLHDVVYPAVLKEQGNVEDESPYFGAIGGQVTYEFTPTSIGVILVVECCGYTLDLTDYSSW